MKREDKNILFSEEIAKCVEWIIAKRGQESAKGYITLLVAVILTLLLSIYYLVSFNG